MKEINFTRIILLITSFLMLIAGFIMPNGDVTISIFATLAIVSLVVLDIKAPKIVKLSEDNPKIKTFRFLNMLSLFVFILISIFAALSPNNEISITEDNKTLVIGLISVFIMIFGNLSPKIPFNRYLGLRLPWTIRDEDTWRVAHRLLGYLSFPIAILMFIMSFFFDGDMVGSMWVLAWFIIPSVYSFIFYYKKIKGINIL